MGGLVFKDVNDGVKTFLVWHLVFNQSNSEHSQVNLAGLSDGLVDCVQVLHRLHHHSLLLVHSVHGVIIVFLVCVNLDALVGRLCSSLVDDPEEVFTQDCGLLVSGLQLDVLMQIVRLPRSVRAPVYIDYRLPPQVDPDNFLILQLTQLLDYFLESFLRWLPDSVHGETGNVPEIWSSFDLLQRVFQDMDPIKVVRLYEEVTQVEDGVELLLSHGGLSSF